MAISRLALLVGYAAAPAELAAAPPISQPPPILLAVRLSSAWLGHCGLRHSSSAKVEIGSQIHTRHRSV